MRSSDTPSRDSSPGSIAFWIATMPKARLAIVSSSAVSITIATAVATWNTSRQIRPMR